MKRFNDYTTYLKDQFGCSIRKISVNAGNTCPNRDGAKGRGGCTYCNITSLKVSYQVEYQSVTAQIDAGIQYFSKRRQAERYLAYFQSYTNTYGTVDGLMAQYREALHHPMIAGIVIGTRPDCVSEELADALQGIATKSYVSVELGIESTEEETLRRTNRCHTFGDTKNAINILSGRGIHIGGHLILGFPWETRETWMAHATRLSSLRIESLKLHHLQILRQTRMASEYSRKPFSLPTMAEYLDGVISFVELCRPDIVFQRFIAEAPQALLIAPDWGGLRNNQFTDKLRREMEILETWQGRFWETNPSPSAKFAQQQRVAQ